MLSPQKVKKTFCHNDLLCCNLPPNELGDSSNGHLGHSFRGIYLDSLIIARDGKRKMPNLNFITNRSKFGGGTYIVCGPRLCSSAIKVPKRITRSSSRFKGQYI